MQEEDHFHESKRKESPINHPIIIKRRKLNVAGKNS